jgi:hypothetical protein
MGDIRRLAGIDVVDAGCIIKGGHGHDRCRQAKGRQAPQRAPPKSGRTRCSEPTEQRFPHVERPTANNPTTRAWMAGAEEPPFMGPADPTPASGAGQRFSLDRIASTSYRTDLAVPVASRGRVRR